MCKATFLEKEIRKLECLDCYNCCPLLFKGRGVVGYVLPLSEVVLFVWQLVASSRFLMGHGLSFV